MNIANFIIMLASVISALAIIIGVPKAILKYRDTQKEKKRIEQERNEKQDKAIASIKEEQTLICYAVSSCLDGLEQLGANHSVPIAKNKLNKYLNQKAHKGE